MTEIAHDDRTLLGPIQAKLRRLIWRTRTVLALRGTACTLAAAVLAILAAMGVASQWLIVDAWQHYALTALWVAAAAAAAVLTLVRPLARTFTLRGIARAIEQRHPELKERISSTVELLASGDAPEVRGSAALIHALAVEARDDARTVQPRREVSFRGARVPAAVLAGAVAVIAALLALYPQPAGRLLAKTLFPPLNVQNVHAKHLTVTPGDRTVAEGRQVEVRAVVTGPMAAKVRSAELHTRADDGPDRVLDMTDLHDGAFGFTTAPLKASIQYRVRAGDALSRYYTITVVPRPAVRRIDIGYDYPEYMRRRGVAPSPSRGGVIDAPAGTVATVHLRLNKPVAVARLTVNDEPVEARRLDGAGEVLSFRHTLDGATPKGQWRLELVDEHGIPGDPIARAIHVHPDLPPRVSILRPAPSVVKLPPTDRLPVRYSVGDDIGIASAELLVSVDGRELPPTPLDLAASRPATTTAPLFAERLTVLELARLDLDGAKQVTFQVRARDNLPEQLGGPQEGLSGLRTIELEGQADPYVLQVQLAMDLRIREALEEIYKELKAAKAVSAPLRRSMPSIKELSAETGAKIDALRGRLHTAERIAREIAAASEGGQYPEMSKTLKDLADKHVGKARELVGLLKLTDAVKQRAQMADEADFQIDRALAIVSELLKKFAVWTDLARKALELELLAQRQEELAANQAMAATTQPAEGAEAGDAKPMNDEEWQKAQRELARDTADLLRETPGGVHEEMKRQASQAKALDAMADNLRRSQQALMQKARAAEKLKQMREELANLARQQKALAAKTDALAQQAKPVHAATQPAADASRNAAQAAKDLATPKPADALARQDAAANDLDQTAKQAADEPKRAAAAELARTAREMARQEADLAKKAAAAADQLKQADAADQAARAAADRQKKLTDEIKAGAGDLAKRQAALAERARKVEAAEKPSAKARPAEPMAQAAKDLAKGDPGAAAKPSAQAADKAKALAGETGAKADAAKKASADAAARAAPDATAPARQAADAARKRADAAAAKAAAARKAADQAAARAKAAGDRSRQAAAKAAQTGAEPDKQAAQAADKAAAQAQARAAAADKQAQADRQAASAEGAKAQAAQRAADAPAQAAAKAAARAAQARASADESKKIADDQAALSREIAAAAQQAAPKAAQAAKAGQTAAAQQAKADAARQAAGKALANVPSGQQGLNRQMAQLKQLAARATPEAQAAVRKDDPTTNMRQASAELARKKPEPASKAQKAAADQLERIAQAAGPAQAPASPQRAAQVAGQAAQLARDQRALRRKTATLLSQLARAEATMTQQELTRLRAEQARIAREAAKLADEVGEHAPQGDRVDRQAARKAAETSRELARGRLAEASRAGEQAARAMNETARRMGQGEQGEAGEQGEPGESGEVQAATPDSPDGAGGQAQRRARMGRQAGDLARRQQRVADEAAALDRKRADQVLASQQRRIAEGTEEVAEGAKLLGEHVEDMMQDPAAKKLIDQAAQALDQASQAQRASEQAMTRGQPAQSVPSQDRSQQALGQATAALRQVGQLAAAEARKAPPATAAQQQDLPPGQLADAHDAAQSAASNPGDDAAARAAEMLAALARQLSGRAQAMGVMPMAGLPGQMSEGWTFDSKTGTGPTGLGPLELGRLRELGLTPADWTRLPEHLRDHVLQAARRGGPEEYRTLIKHYFQAIARKGAAAPGKAPAPK